MIDFIKTKIQQSLDLKAAVMNNAELLDTTDKVGEAIVTCFKNGGKVLWCGNGGSAADAQHLSAELTGRFYYDRPPLFSEALHVNTSYITAVANDYDYNVIYGRLVQAMGRPGDVLIGLSTSGNSPNVVNALKEANAIGMVTVGFTGETGGAMKDICQYLINIPSRDTPRIQECHMLLGHTLCEITEMKVFPKA